MKHARLWNTLALLLEIGTVVAVAQREGADDEERNVGAYTLPDPLTFMSGTHVENATDWRLRREEILELYRENVHGRTPPEF